MRNRFKKFREPRKHFMQNGHNKERNDMELTESENIKKR